MSSQACHYFQADVFAHCLVALKPLGSLTALAADTVLLFTKDVLHVLTSAKKGAAVLEPCPCPFGLFKHWLLPFRRLLSTKAEA